MKVSFRWSVTKVIEATDVICFPFVSSLLLIVTTPNKQDVLFQNMLSFENVRLFLHSSD